MAQQGQQQGQQAGMGTGILLLMGMVSIFIAAMWFVKHDIVVWVFLQYAYYLSFIPAWLSHAVGWQSSPAMTLIREIADHSHHLGAVDGAQLFSVVNKASMTLLPLTLLIAYYAMYVHRHVLRNMEGMHDYWQLMKLQSLTNPCIVPVVRFTEYWREKGIERHINLFRALTPDEFATKHALLKSNGEEVLLDFDKSAKVFSEQLGGLLSDGVLSEQYKAIAAICMTRIIYRGAEGRKKGMDMLDYINKSCDPNKTGNKADADCFAAFDFSVAAAQYDELIKHDDIKLIKTYFVHKKTFLMRLLNEARSDGKLQPAEFTWLKLIDRDLYYALYGVSKKLIAKGYCEGSAAFAQYWAAIAAMNNGQVLVEPHMDEAVRALEKRLFEANMISERLHMTEKERERELTFGRIPEV